MTDENFDYIIVGAGSAGCVLANRLSANPEVKILLLEAGPTDYSFFIHMPGAHSYLHHSDRFNWLYDSEPNPHTYNRVFPCPRGRVVGGSSSINGMGFLRGHALDFDTWAGNKMPNWSYAHCLPYYKKMETFGGKPSEYRGNSGPMKITVPEKDQPLWNAFAEACRQAGYPDSDDTNGFQQEGFCTLDQSIHNGKRWSTAVGYLEPVKHRDNLTIRTKCLTTRVLFKNTTAAGVEYRQEGTYKIAHAEHEVILASGAINSPQLLMLSGIGPANHLKSLGIPVTVDLPGVGQNLQDHIDVVTQYECTQPITLLREMRPLAKIKSGVKWFISKKGAAASNHFEVGAHIRGRPGLKQPDLQFCFIPISFSYETFAPTKFHGFQTHVIQSHPKSRGNIKLNSNSPKDTPSIQFNYFAEEYDREVISDGIKLMREIHEQEALKPFTGREIRPGPKIQSKQDLIDYALKTGRPNHHPCGTCKMGFDDLAVVDDELRVHGIEGLRVVDASIMPRIVSGALNAPVIMIAEKAADMITNSPPLDPLFLPVYQPEDWVTNAR